MQRNRNNRGQMRVIEVVLASFIVISAISFLTIFSAPPTTPGLEVSDLEKMGYGVLLDLDNQGLLAPMVYGTPSLSLSDLRIAMKITLPVEVYFKLVVYDASWTPIGSPILYGDEETFASSNNTASVSYVLSGFAAKYNPRILVLQLSRG